jgi:hypothetical protein
MTNEEIRMRLQMIRIESSITSYFVTLWLGATCLLAIASLLIVVFAT